MPGVVKSYISQQQENAHEALLDRFGEIGEREAKAQLLHFLEHTSSQAKADLRQMERENPGATYMQLLERHELARAGPTQSGGKSMTEATEPELRRGQPQLRPELETTNPINHERTSSMPTIPEPSEDKVKTEISNHSEAIAKRQLIETLQEKHTHAYQPGENTKVVLERATQGAREELAVMQKQNPGASYSEMLERVKPPEEKQQISQNKGQAQAIAV